jgi:hypothetical protein
LLELEFRDSPPTARGQLAGGCSLVELKLAGVLQVELELGD